MSDSPDFEALRTAVHDACREANKGIFNHLEDVLLRLVDAIEAGNVRAERLLTALLLIEEVTTRPDLDDKSARGSAWSFAAVALDGPRPASVVSTERRERDGGQ